MRRHPIDLLSLVFGTLIFGVGAWLLFGDVEPSYFDARYAAPVTIGLVGVLLLAIGTMRTGRDHRVVDESETPAPNNDSEASD